MGNGPLPRFHDLARAVSATNRGFVTGPHSGPAQRPASTGRFVCPRCEERFGVEGTCDRCRLDVVDATRFILAAPAAEALVSPSGLAGGAMAGLAAIALGVAVAVGLTVEALDAGQASFLRFDSLLWGLTGLAVSIPATYLAVQAIGRGLRARRARETWRRLRALASAALPLRTADLVFADLAPVRVRGRLRFVLGPSGLEGRLVDETGAVPLALRGRPAIRAVSSAAEVHVVGEGDEVEWVGTPQARLATPDDYRNRELELELEGHTLWLVKRA